MSRFIRIIAVFLIPFAGQGVCTVPGPSDIVSIHLERIASSDFSGAEMLFSDAFRAAILPDVKLVNAYLLGRKEAIAGGSFEVLPPVILEEDRFASVQAAFEGDRVFYYLIRESSGWRIEAFSDTEYTNFAEGRRGMYLFTSRDWNDTGSKELKCRANLYLIQQALENYFDGKGNGGYPVKLAGGGGTDALTSWGYIATETGYPLNYFTRKPMKQVRLDKPEPGDFTYLPIDSDGDGNYESYFLLGWGTPETQYRLFKEIQIVGFLAAADERTFEEAIADFVRYASGRLGVELTSSK